MNSIAQVKTIAVDGPNGPTTAIMIALNVGDAGAADSFVIEVAEQFKLNRMLASPDTSMLLVTIIGDLSAGEFAAKWADVVKHDEVVRTFMSLMTIADVVQGTKKVGQQLSKASLLTERPIPAPEREKPWWKRW